MKIAIFSDLDLDVTEGVKLLLTKYADKSPEVFFPVNADLTNFAQTVIKVCLDKGIKTTVFYTTAVGLEAITTQADTGIVTDSPVLEIIHQLTTGDAVGIGWTDGENDHTILHSIEDLALDVWDITDGLDKIEIDDEPFGGMDSDRLRTLLNYAVNDMVNLMAAFVASTVMESLGQAVAEHIAEGLGQKDISPFDDLD